MQRLAIGAGIATVVALALSACSGQGESPSSTAPPSASASSSTTLDLKKFTPVPDGVIDEDTDETITARPVPTWDQQSRTAAIQAAQTAMAVFARPSLEYTTWWAELSPLLTRQAQQDYAYVDPANVPATAVTGTPLVVNETSAYVANVEVPTDVGTYTLVLTRVDADSPWLASRFTPPEGVN